MSKWILYTDGAAAGVCGGWGFDATCGSESHRKFGPLEDATCNIAEYEGLKRGLEFCSLKTDKVQVYVDSRLIQLQTLGVWKTRKAHLIPYRDECRKLLKKFSWARIDWVPSAENVADEASKLGLKDALDRAAKEGRFVWTEKRLEREVTKVLGIYAKPSQIRAFLRSLSI